MLRFNVRKVALGLVAAGLLLVGSATARADDQNELVADALQTKATFIKADPGLATFFARAPGHVVFSSIGKAAVGIGGAHGSGVVFENNRPVGKATLSQLSVGAQLGGQSYEEVIFFETPAALHNFMSGNFAFSGSVSAVALKSGAAANAKYKDGVAVFTATKAGLMLEAAVGGQKFGFEPFPVKR
jgi:lipid-binding SYLF domain-containing protein